MFAAAAIVWPGAPARVPMHWDVGGQVDRYGGKFEGLLGLPLLALGLFAAFFSPARQALLPQLVRQDQLVEANSISSGSVPGRPFTTTRGL